MAQAARAIILQDDNILVMHRNKYGTQYYTLVGGRVSEGETVEQGLVREIKEETGLEITSARLVYFEEHPEPYNQQYIYLCEVAPNSSIAIQPDSEEAAMNRVDLNIHKPEWVSKKNFSRLAFRTPQLQEAITKALDKGFPKEPVRL